MSSGNTPANTAWTASTTGTPTSAGKNVPKQSSKPGGAGKNLSVLHIQTGGCPVRLLRRTAPAGYGGGVRLWVPAGYGPAVKTGRAKPPAPASLHLNLFHHEGLDHVALLDITVLLNPDAAHPTKSPILRGPRILQCSAEMNSACANLCLRLRFYAPFGAPRCAGYSCGIIPLFVPSRRPQSRRPP